MFLTQSAKQVDNQIKSIKSSGALAKEGIVTNPPYGVRTGEQQELAEFYPKLGDVLKQKSTGWRAYLLSADMHR